MDGCRCVEAVPQQFLDDANVPAPGSEVEKVVLFMVLQMITKSSQIRNVSSSTYRGGLADFLEGRVAELMQSNVDEGEARLAGL